MLTRRELGLRSMGAAAGLSLTGGAMSLFAPANAARAQAAETTGEPFGFETVVRRAADLAAAEFKPRVETLPPGSGLDDYDRYRNIRFRPEAALWREEGLPFQIQLFHVGLFYKAPVTINIIDGNQIVPLTFSRDLFDYGKDVVPPELPADLGFAGFRLHAPMNVPTYYDEVAVFLGASYFRAIGKGQIYGLSARGLAIDTALPKGEEFPFFREFWIEKPRPGDTQAIVYALLDSQSCTGAYRFVIRPGDPTEIDVQNHLVTRQDIRKLGVAPLTSMFLYGEDGTRHFEDFRPEVHDSDGLLIQSGSGEWIWRPLGNPQKLRVSVYQQENVKGFGLLQRDRDFRSYEDLEALYHQRPSCWIEPLSPWGAGHVELIEIPSEEEKYDNIVSFWVPAEPVKGGQVLNFEYRMSFAKKMEGRPPEGRVLATRITTGPKPESRRFILDFNGGRLSDLKSSEPVSIVVNTSSGHIGDPVTQKNIVTGGWRAFFDLYPEDTKPVELRAFLRLGEEKLTETWSYQWGAA